jgi:Uma2 family endonuclease
MTAARKQTELFSSPEEYLERETLAAEKHEYYDGEIVPMAGASINHNYIVGNLYFLLRVALKGKDYIPFATDLRLWVPARNTYTYPDVLVVAGPPLHHDERSDTITNPVMLLEVLSDTTSHYDRGEKFVGYRTLPTLRDYLLVDQSRCLVEQFARVEQNKWLLTEYHEMEQVVELSFEPICLALRDIYERVAFPPPPEHPPESVSESKQPEGKHES